MTRVSQLALQLAADLPLDESLAMTVGDEYFSRR